MDHVIYIKHVHFVMDSSLIFKSCNPKSAYQKGHNPKPAYGQLGMPSYELRYYTLELPFIDILFVLDR